MNWLRNFMIGRYGVDPLTIALFILSMLITFIGSLFDMPLIKLLGYVPLCFGIYRMLSKNISKRSMENNQFLTIMRPVYAWIRSAGQRFGDKTHKYYKCPNCKTKLRVPKGKGKIIITCCKCKTQFQKKT